MKVTVKKLDAIRREMRFEVPPERVTQTLNTVYDSLGKVAKVKGFRPGKVPRQVLEAEHSALAQEETIKKLIPEVYREGIERENLAPIDLPDIKDVELKNGLMTFTATIDIKPDVKIKHYKGIKVKRKSNRVTEEEVKKTLEYFRQSQGQGEEVAIDDAFARGLGYPDLNSFQQSLTRQLEIDKDRQNRMDVENQIVQALLKEAKLVVPSSLVRKQLEHRIQEARKRMQTQKLPEADITKKEEELRKNLKDAVERDVKIFLILDAIAHNEGLVAGENENMPAKVLSFLMKEAQWQDVPG